MNPRIAAALAAGTAIAATLTACSPSTYGQAPSAYGEKGDCYYVDSPAEADALRDAGLCPVNWGSAPMPGYWRNQYAWYYGSPSYYDTYVPSPQRRVYVERVKVYEKANPQAAKSAPRPAKSAKYSAGNGRAGGDAGTSKKTITTKSKAGSSKSYSSGSRSSGSSRSYSSGSRR